MIYNIEDYEEFIKSLLRRIPLCYTTQLNRALCNSFENVSEEIAEKILFSIQRRGYVLLSQDGWAMAKGVVQRITQTRNGEYYSDNPLYKLPPMNEYIKDANVDLDTLDCFWIALDMLPDSENFVLTDTPWNMCFEIKGEGENAANLYQVTKIPEEAEDARCLLLASLPPVEFSQFKNIVRRIAIIENEEHAWMVPHIGFTHICKIDLRCNRKYKIIETREGNSVWEDQE